jgi:ankyrin repeat protein
LTSNWILDHNFQDVEGKTALHHAIENGHHKIIGFLLDQSGLDLTIRDKSGLSPFAAAMTFRNNVAARRILQVSTYSQVLITGRRYPDGISSGY